MPTPRQRADAAIDRLREFFTDQRHGMTIEEFADTIERVSAACIEHNSKGTVSLKITMSPMKDVPRALKITDAISESTPKAPRQGSIFYGRENGALTREDPAQWEIPGTTRNDLERGVGTDAVIDATARPVTLTAEALANLDPTMLRDALRAQGHDITSVTVDSKPSDPPTDEPGDDADGLRVHG